MRVWVSGCATGEEAYSLAILLAERNARRERPLPVQVFASDIDESALEFARQGTYPDSIATDVSKERLKQFFTQEGNSYTVKEALRETILFTPHNLIKDPPFSKLNLVTCRNLLIYLDTSLQEQVYKVFHYALRPGGFSLFGQLRGARAGDEPLQRGRPQSQAVRAQCRAVPGLFSPYTEARDLRK